MLKQRTLDDKAVRSSFKLLIGLALLMLPSIVLAATPHSTQLYENVQSAFFQRFIDWFDTFNSYAKQVFLTLATAELVVTGISWALFRSDAESLPQNAFKKVLTLGFWWTVVAYAPYWSLGIVKLFTYPAQQATGIHSLSPGSVLDQGLDLAAAVIRNSTGGSTMHIISAIENMPQELLAGLIGIVILVLYTLVAMVLLLALIEAAYILLIGSYLVAFGALRFTADYAHRYVSAAIATGVRLMTVYLIVALGTVLMGYAKQAAQAGTIGGTMWHDMLLLVAVLTYCAMAIRIPTLAANLLSGQLSFGFGEVASGAAVAGGAIAGAAVAGAGAYAFARGVGSSALGAAASLHARGGVGGAPVAAAASGGGGGGGGGGVGATAVPSGGVARSAAPPASSARSAGRAGPSPSPSANSASADVVSSAAPSPAGATPPSGSTTDSTTPRGGGSAAAQPARPAASGSAAAAAKPPARPHFDYLFSMRQQARGALRHASDTAAVSGQGIKQTGHEE